MCYLNKDLYDNLWNNYRFIKIKIQENEAEQPKDCQNNNFLKKKVYVDTKPKQRK